MHVAQIHIETFVDIFEKLEVQAHHETGSTVSFNGIHPQLGSTILIQGIDGFAIVSALPLSSYLASTNADATKSSPLQCYK